MSRPDTYEILVEGVLSDHWGDWFEGLRFEPAGEGVTRLCGPLSDQSALLGVLNQIHALNLPLISVTRRPPGAEDQDAIRFRCS